MRREQAWLERLGPYYRELGLDPSHPSPRTDFPPFDEAMCTVVEAVRPEVVSFHFGLPEPSLLARVKAAGCRVMSSATTVEEARWLEERGADAIIAQGAEAGGHRGTFLAADMDAETARQSGTFVLVPQGVAGAGRSRNRSDQRIHRAAGARPGQSSGWRSRPDLGRNAGFSIADGSHMAAMGILRAKAEERGSIDFTPLWAGQAAALCREMPAETLTRALAVETLRRFRQFAEEVGQGGPPAGNRRPA